MSFIPAEDVKAPTDVSLKEIILNEGLGGAVIATGEWNDTNCALLRWNGTDEKVLGFPQSSAKPVWIVIPDWAKDALLGAALLQKKLAEKNK